MIVESAFATSGQRCTCARRLIVPQGERNNAVLTALVALTQRLRVGAPLDEPEPYMGALINNTQAEHVLQAQSRLRGLGARSLVEATRLHAELPFLSPGVVDVTAVSGVPDEEVFGALLQVIRVRDLDEAVLVANDTAYGLSAGLLSDRAGHYEYVYPRLKAGILNYNRPLTGAASAAPFGGPGRSGNYRPSAYYAADYCAYPVATLAGEQAGGVSLPGLQDV
jgi:succinylglutamic semialdehyde dehydrogenase